MQISEILLLPSETQLQGCSWNSLGSAFRLAQATSGRAAEGATSKQGEIES